MFSFCLGVKFQMPTQSRSLKPPCFFHAEIFWLDGNVTFVHGDQFRESADAILVRACLDLVARLEPLHIGADPDDNASRLIAQNERQAIRQDGFELAIHSLRIERI